jgi:hypothetical protein
MAVDPDSTFRENHFRKTLSSATDCSLSSAIMRAPSFLYQNQHKACKEATPADKQNIPHVRPDVCRLIEEMFMICAKLVIFMIQRRDSKVLAAKRNSAIFRSPQLLNSVKFPYKLYSIMTVLIRLTLIEVSYI